MLMSALAVCGEHAHERTSGMWSAGGSPCGTAKIVEVSNSLLCIMNRNRWYKSVPGTKSVPSLSEI